jgi:FkbM family methyltransferase
VTGTVTLPKAGEYRQDVVVCDDLKWVIGRGTNDGLAVNHEMEPSGASIHDFICGMFGPGLTFLDIGAHVGHYALRAAKAGSTVYAVEANPEAAAQLRLNAHINQLTIDVWAVAAWDKPELIEFSRADVAYQIRNGSASLLSSKRNPVPMRLTVSGVPLDTLLDPLDQLDLVKMDVEGADIHVLDGMMASLARLRPLLVFESHHFYGTYTPEEMAAREAELTRRAGYTWADASEWGVRSAEKFRIGSPGTG